MVSTRTALVWAWTIGAAVTIARLGAAFSVPLTGDEAYYWEWSRRLAFGYADHPPAVAWTIAATAWLGRHAGVVRLGFVLCGAVATLALAAAATTFAGGDRRAGAVAALAFTLAPLSSVAFTLATPDGPYLLFWCLALWCGARAFGGGERRWWVALGLAIGGALMSRMLALALVLGVAVLALRRRNEPRVQFGALGALAIAAVAVAPFVIWNAMHSWETLAFTFIHRQDESSGGFSIARLASLYVIALAAYSPGLWIAATVVVLRPRATLAYATAIPLLAVLAVLALVRPVEVYWALGPFASLCAMMGFAFVQLNAHAERRWALWSAVPAAFALVLVFAAALAPGPMYGVLAQRFGVHLRNSGPFEIFTFAPLAREVKAEAAQRDAIVMTDGYGFSSVLDFEAGIPPVVVGYDWQGRESKRWYPSSMQPARALFVDKEPLVERPDVALRLRKACAAVSDGGTLAYAYQSVPPRRYYLTWCDGLVPGGMAILRWERPA